MALSVHPGNVMSGMFLDVFISLVSALIQSNTPEGNVKLFTSLAFGALINFFFSLFFITPFEGGYTPAWASASRKIEENPEMYKGKYLVPFGDIEDPSEDAKKLNLAGELWQTTEKALKDFGWD